MTIFHLKKKKVYKIVHVNKNDNKYLCIEKRMEENEQNVNSNHLRLRTFGGLTFTQISKFSIIKMYYFHDICNGKHFTYM